MTQMLIGAGAKSGFPILITKVLETVRNNTVNPAILDPELQWAVKATGVYRVWGFLYFEMVNSAGGPGNAVYLNPPGGSLGMAGTHPVSFGASNYTSDVATPGSHTEIHNVENSAAAASMGNNVTNGTGGWTNIDWIFRATADDVAGIIWSILSMAASGSTRLRSTSWLYIDKVG